MTEEKLNITRRKVLGSLGAVGIGAAATGLGTTAFLNDTETFEGNTTTAGTLDLKVDWQQHYYGAAEESVFVNAHPDHDGDGEQSIAAGEEVVSYSDDGRNIVDALTCETPSFTDDYDYTGLNEEQDALVWLDDVKPGDSGEITFSLHLCGNPGYLWMGGSEAENSENGYAEPEPTTEEGGDTQDPGEENGRGELAENVEVEMWYDHDCDNSLGEGEEAEIVFTLDASGSMFYDQYGGVVRDDPITVAGDPRPETTKIDLVEQGVRQFLTAMDDAGADVEVGVVFFDGFDPDNGSLSNAQLDTYTLQSPSSLDSALGNFREVVSNLTGGGSTPSDSNGVSTGTALTPGIEEAQGVLDSGQPDVQSVNIIFTDGEPYRDGTLEDEYFDEAADAATDARASTPSPATDVYVIGDETSDARANDLVLDMAGAADSPGADHSHLFDLSDEGTIPRLFQQVALLFLPEESFFNGTLAEALDAFEEDNGIPLDSNRFVEGTNYYLPEMTQCVGFDWELPAEVGNEVQGDSIAFNLGFYGEQARHNGESAD